MVGYAGFMIKPSESPEAWQRCLQVVRPALLLAPATYLQDLQDRLAAEGIQAAVARHDTKILFDWTVRLLDRQGISNSAAIAYADRHGGAHWHEVEAALAGRPRCSKLQSYWHFDGCGYRKEAQSCACPDLLPGCSLSSLPARKGALSRAAFGLALFARDVCGGDLVGWIDDRLAAADPGPEAVDRGTAMRRALLDPLVNIAGTGPKVWSMILAELLLGGDPGREPWVATGASFIAVDSLVHNFLWRSGILRHLDVEHLYGLRCHAPGGCVEVITGLAERIDAREFNPAFPNVFPRWIQFAIWLFCAEGGWSICNAINIDDCERCVQSFCPAFAACDRVPVLALKH